MSEFNQSIIRKKIRTQRNLLTQNEVEFKSQKIIHNIITDLFPQLGDISHKKIALYFSTNNEVHTHEILKHLENHHIALPFINEKNELDFKKYLIGDELINHKIYKNILEPAAKNENIIPEILLIPLVACDKNGHRIGMGGGFYDKKIAELRGNGQNITVIGLAYDFQILEKIEPNKFDQTLDFIASETGVIKCH